MAARPGVVSTLVGLLLPWLSMVIPSQAFATDRAPAKIEIHWAVVSNGPVELSDTVLLLTEVGKEEPAMLRERLPVLPAALEIAAGSWQVEVESSEVWTSPAEWRLSPGATMDLRLWPAGWLEARVPTTVRSLSLRLEKPGARLRAENLECPVVEAVARCKVPAGTLDLRFDRPGDFAPIYFWGLGVAPGKRVELGDLQFRTGSSLVGRVAAETEDLEADDLEDLVVEVVPVVGALRAEPSGVDRIGTRTSRAKVVEGGYYQVVGLPAGLYEVAATHPNFATGRVGPISIGPGEALEADTVYLPPPTRLTLEMSIPRDPYGGLWEGTLYRRGGDQTYLDEIDRQTMHVDGRAVFADLEPGSYWTSVTTSRGATWYSAAVEVLPGENSWPVEVELTRLEGLVTWQEEPVRGYEVLFRDPATGRTFSFPEAQDGRFFAILPTAVQWELTIEQPGEGIYTKFLDFVVPQRRSPDRWPTVELEVPGTLVEGVVVPSSAGSLPSDLAVELSAADVQLVARVRADGGGAFVFRGPPEREHYEIRARGNRGESQSQVEQFSLSEEAPVGPVRLVLEANHRLRGQVVGPLGDGVAATKLVAVPRNRRGGGKWLSEEVGLGDSDGIFEMSLPTDIEDVWITLFPPGYGVRTFLVRLPVEEPWILPVEKPAGSVVVRYPDPPEALRTATVARFSGDFVYLKPHTVLVGPHGPIGGFFAMGKWRRWHGVFDDGPLRMTFPALEAGEYSACFGRRANVATRAGRPLPPLVEKELCASGFLSDGGELILDLPASALTAEARLLERESSDSGK